MLKRAIESLLRGSGLPRVTRGRRRSSALVLAYHNIVPDGERPTGDLSLHLPQASFSAQLDLLASTHDIVSLDEAVRPVDAPARPRAAITFDDAYRGAVQAGVSELVRRGLPATIFVAPAFVGGGTFWWDVLADDSGLPDAIRSHALTALRGEDSAIRRWASGQGIRERALPDHQTVATEAELAEATRNAGIQLAAHTWSHPNLATLEDDRLESEIARPLQWLRARFEGVAPWVSYPYGLWSPAAERAAEAAGYEGGLRVDGGWLDPARMQTPRFAIPRLNIPAGVSLAGFELRTSGVLTR